MKLSFERQLQEFVADPDNHRAFDALEEQLFLGGHWDELVEVYRTRLNAPSLADDAAGRADLLFRLGQVLEERCLDAEQAQRTYWEVAHTDPSYAPAFRQLRRLHARNHQWDVVLQVAEVEGQLDLQPYKRAEYLTDMGRVWLDHMSEPGQALECFDAALEACPTYVDGLSGRARALEVLERYAESAGAWEKLVESQRGPDRSPPLVAWARLMAGPLADPDRAIELYRRALTDDPRNEAAVEALAILAATRGQWELVRDLFERRFDLAAGARRRTGIALEAGHMYLERFSDPQLARMWFGRALELTPDDAAVHQSIAELERLAGNDGALSESLEQVVGIAGQSAPVSVLLETANLRSERGEEPAALELLRIAYQRTPENPLVLEALSDSLNRLGQHEELAEVLDQRAALASDDPELQVDALCELGRIHEERLSDADAALDAYSRAFALRPDAPGVAKRLVALHHKAEDWAEMRHFLERAADHAAENERSTYRCELGELLFERFDDVDGAACAFELALDSDGEDSRALRGLARLADHTGDGEAMLRVRAREAEVTTDRERKAQLLRELVDGLEERGRSEEALPWAEQWATACPEDRIPLEVLSRLQERLGRQNDLARSLERLDPLLAGGEQAENRRRLATLQEDEERAITWAERAVESQPNDLESLRALCDRYRDASRLEDQARVQRRLAEQLPPEQQLRCLDELSRLLEDQLGDVDGAVVVLWRLHEIPGCPEDTAERLAQLLERIGRFEELAQLLLERRRSVANDSAEATRIDLERARLLLDHLGQAEEATAVLHAVRDREPGNAEATATLERALRLQNDPLALATLLGELARDESDPARRAARELECATLLEEGGGHVERAMEAYATLADGSADVEIARQASERLEALLERKGEWTALRDRLVGRIDPADRSAALALRERLAILCRDRLGDREACIAHLEAAGELAPDRDSVWRSLGLLYREADRKSDWSRVIARELATGPARDREHSLRSTAARLALEDGRRDDAREQYEGLLALDPGHVEASEFLIEQYDREGRPADVVRMLESRLEAVEAGGSSEAISMRLRIAALRADALNDAPSAISVLEEGLDDLLHEAVVAEPLAHLYQRCSRFDDLAALCRRRAESVEDEGERASWFMRLADVLRDRRDTDGAVQAYRSVLAARPGDRDASAALRQLFRERGDAEPLAELLEIQLDPASGDDPLPILVELAELMAGPLDRPSQALEHFKRVLAIAPDHAQVFGRAVELAESLDRQDDLLTLLDERLDGHLSPSERAALLTRRGDLLVGLPERSDEAPAVYREALALDPGQREARRGLRSALERLEMWPAVLDCLFVEAGGADPAERETILETAAGIAAEHLSRDAALPWLERLRATRPDDADVLRRIAGIHREAGRSESLLRAIEDELELVDETQRRLELSLERARILESDLRAPERALRVLEETRDAFGDRPECLAALDRLYDSTGRVRERAGILETRLQVGDTSPEVVLELHRTLAELWQGPLGEPVHALPHRRRMVELGGEGEADRSAALRELTEALGSTDLRESWSQAAETELAALGVRDADESSARRLALHEQLGRAYAEELGRDRDALVHWRSLVETDREVEAEARERAVRGLLDGLRACGEIVELERRLTERLEADESTAAAWLELARLRDERLHRPAAAAEAYRRATTLDDSDLAVWRGLRGVAERLGDWECVADCLEREAELAHESESASRAARWRRIGEVAWQRIGDTDRARRAYRRALEADSDDLDALRSLAAIARLQDDWAAERDHCHRELELLADEAGHEERRGELWLRIGHLERDRGEDDRSALEAFEAADASRALVGDDRRDWAQLYRRTDDMARFAEVFASWCDAPDAAASWSDHLELARALESLDRQEDALGRVRRATTLDPDSAEPWLLQAALLERVERLGEAAEALESAADRVDPSEGASLLRRAADLVEPEGHDRALAHLRRAMALDAAHLGGRAALARVAAAGDHWAEAESAAAVVLDLASAQAEPAGPDDSDRGVSADVRLATALVGGRAARAQGRIDAAIGFYSAALALDAESRDARAGLGECLFEIGDRNGARAALLPLCGDGDEAAALHLAAVGAACEAEGDTAQALEWFEKAIAVDPRVSDAHAGRARIHACEDSVDDALAAFEAWAEHTPDAVRRGEILLKAARLARDAERGEEALARWKAASEADPGRGAAWSERAEWLLATGERPSEAVEVADEGLSRCEDTETAARLQRVRGRVFEAEKRVAEAAEAWAAVVENDPRDCEAALARARLLRTGGDWPGASRCLEEFSAGHPEADHWDLAEVHVERGRLLSGPLENVEEALRCYESALRIDADRIDALEPMARLLGHVPERESEAFELHRRLLELEPTRAASIRALNALAERRADEASRDAGLALLRALGAASPDESARAPHGWPIRLGERPAMNDPVAESMRRLIQETAREIASAYALSAERPEVRGRSDEETAWLSALREEEDQLGAPGLAGLDVDALAGVLNGVATAVLDPRAIAPEDANTASLERALGMWSRRRLRRMLEGVSLSDVAAMDAARWRADLEGLAAHAALDRCGGDLRTALLAMALDAGEPLPAESADLTDLVRRSTAATNLLHQAITTWCDSMRTR